MNEVTGRETHVRNRDGFSVPDKLSQSLNPLYMKAHLHSSAERGAL